MRVLLNASDLTVYDGRTPVVSHERLLGKGGARLELDHYLETFVRKPGALPGATVLEQARAAGTFTPAHEAWWAAACKAHGDADGTRALIEVLLLHRHMPHQQVLAGIQAALKAGALTADVVALEARKTAETDDTSATDSPPSAADGAPTTEPVASLTERRLTQLATDTRPMPSIAAYDGLLSHHRRTPTS